MSPFDLFLSPAPSARGGMIDRGIGVYVGGPITAKNVDDYLDHGIPLPGIRIDPLSAAHCTDGSLQY